MSDLAGKPINGNIKHYTRSRQVVQHAPEKLIEVLDALVGLKEVDSVRWEQYTPYFNDGDPCYFSIGEIRVKFVDTNEDEDNEGDYGDYYLCSYELDEITFPEVERCLSALYKEIDHHEVVIHDKFGDPAQVTYNGEKFVVEHYDHD